MKNGSFVIVIGGFAGAGKTTIAAMLARDFNHAVYSTDTINDALRDSFNKSHSMKCPLTLTIYCGIWFANNSKVV